MVVLGNPPPRPPNAVPVRCGRCRCVAEKGFGTRDVHARAPNPESRGPRMEARGIEPRSENDSDTATTCVDEACGLTTAAPRRPRQRQALRTSYMTRSGPRSRQPDFAIRERRLRRAATHAGA